MFQLPCPRPGLSSVPYQLLKAPSVFATVCNLCRSSPILAPGIMPNSFRSNRIVINRSAYVIIVSANLVAGLWAGIGLWRWRNFGFGYCDAETGVNVIRFRHVRSQPRFNDRYAANEGITSGTVWSRGVQQSSHRARYRPIVAHWGCTTACPGCRVQ